MACEIINRSITKLKSDIIIKMSSNKSDKELYDEYAKLLKEELDFVESEISDLLKKIHSLADAESKQYHAKLEEAVKANDKDKIRQIIDKINSI